jgi:hypothetical protein
MSANNYILIKEGSKYWKVMECDADTDHIFSKPVKHSALKEAVISAQDMLNTGEIEYGIHFQLKDKLNHL